MKWIFALNAESVESYGDLVRVAVTSARHHSSLDAVCLFHGAECELTRWLQDCGVQVVQARLRFHEQLRQLETERKASGWVQVGGGAFLRLEIPRLARELGWKDEFAFYTDCDVMFGSDPRPLLEPLRPRFFAGCPEFSKRRHLLLNTGAMWMNLANLEADRGFEAWIRLNLERCVHFAFDQGAYRVFYNPLHRLVWHQNISNALFYRAAGRVPLRTWK